MQHSRNNRALVVSSAFAAGDAAQRVGLEAYSYHFVYRAFAPLLERWAPTTEINRAESRLDYALWQARQRHQEPMHLSFLPLHLTYLTARAPNIAFPFWEFPDIPNEDFANNPRSNWARIAGRLDLILTASSFTRDAFARAGVRTPVHVVPVPIRPEYFDVPAWEPKQTVVLDCPCYRFPPEAAETPPTESAYVPASPRPTLSAKGLARHVYKNLVKPLLPGRVAKCLAITARAAAAARRAHEEDVQIAYPASPSLELSGIVFTTILNPFDPRKNWHDLLSAYLLALGDREDATLVIKLVVARHEAAAGLNHVLNHYQGLKLRHRCRLVLVTAYLSDAQMVELARASTYYVNAARAEGACLPLQDFLAAGRPGIAPTHTAMAEYFDPEVGFVVASHREPAYWPHDPERRIISTWQRLYLGLHSLYLPVEVTEHRYTTSWNRLVWQSLFEQFQAAYTCAKEQTKRYPELAQAGRQRMVGFASAEAVWPRLEAALNQVAEASPRQSRAAA